MFALVIYGLEICQTILSLNQKKGKIRIFQALSMFLDERGQDVVQKNLFRNFCLHLVRTFIMLTKSSLGRTFIIIYVD